jgi:hypothetical protein
VHDSPDRSSRSSVHCYQTLTYRISGKPLPQVCHIGTLEEVTEISTFCSSANSRQKPLMAAAIPKYYSLAESNSCDKD